MNTPKYGVVIILYNPSTDNIQNVLRLSQIYYGIIVDNSNNAILENENIGLMQYIPCHKNIGIAEAQNIGIKCLMQMPSIKYVLFLDQDTTINDIYVESLVNEYIKYQSIYANLAILGPTIVNKDSKNKYESVIHKDNIIENGLIKRREIISSGSCVSMDIFKKIGVNDTKLFIDYVDFEWCWRAESKGYFCAITPNVQIFHKVGSRDLSFGKYKVIISAPFRYFYQYRNYIWLLKRDYVPMQWKIAHGVKFLLRFIYFPLFVSSGFACWKNMYKGIKAGLTK